MNEDLDALSWTCSLLGVAFFGYLLVCLIYEAWRARDAYKHTRDDTPRIQQHKPVQRWQPIKLSRAQRRALVRAKAKEAARQERAKRRGWRWWPWRRAQNRSH